MEAKVPVQVRAGRTIRAVEALDATFRSWLRSSARYNSWPLSQKLDGVFSNALKKAREEYKAIEDAVAVFESAEREKRASKIAEYSAVADARAKAMNEMLNSDASSTQGDKVEPVF